MRVVAIGGGTGLPVVLRGLKRSLYAAEPAGPGAGSRDRLTAIVTVADDGGSSGRLRRAYGVLATGDARNCLLALAEGNAALRTLFGFRFGGRGDLGGHSLGNLILTALSLQHGDFLTAVKRAGELLAVRGRVLPSTLSDISLLAELADGTRVRGESSIGRARSPIRRVRLEPETARLAPEAVAAIRAADLVVIGPGSLYTSLLPPLLVRGLSDAVVGSGARVVLVMNAMTERGETDGMSAADHVAVIRRHAPRLPIHDVLVDASSLPHDVLARYAAAGAEPVRCDASALHALGCRPLRRALLADGRPLRHDPRAVATALLELTAGAAQADQPFPFAPRPPAAAGEEQQVADLAKSVTVE